MDNMITSKLTKTFYLNGKKLTDINMITNQLNKVINTLNIELEIVKNTFVLSFRDNCNFKLLEITFNNDNKIIDYVIQDVFYELDLIQINEIIDFYKSKYGK
jgi:hypothetical protein